MANNWGDTANDGESYRDHRPAPDSAARVLFLLAAVAVILIVGAGGAWFFMARRAMDGQVRDAERAREAQVEQMERVPAR